MLLYTVRYRCDTNIITSTRYSIQQKLVVFVACFFLYALWLACLLACLPFCCFAIAANTRFVPLCPPCSLHKRIMSKLSTEDRATLLQKTKTMMELERTLTATLEKVEPWLLQNAKRQLPNQPRVRPIPTTMEEVERILAVARVWATRTSAPAGWNPAAPVVGFSTPNPLPHQLRGGALAALQLDRARQAERLQKRQRKHAQEEAFIKAEQVEDGKGKDLQQQRQDAKAVEKRSKKDLPSQQPQMTQARAPGVTTTSTKPQVDVSMNLSDSSGSSDEDDDS